MNTDTTVSEILNAIEGLSAQEQVTVLAQLQSYSQKDQPTSTVQENPWLKYAGIFADDPDFEEVLAYIQEYRQELDATEDQMGEDINE